MKPLTQEAREIFLETLTRIAPGAAVRERIRLVGNDLVIDGRATPVGDGAVVIAIGKAGMTLAHAVEELLGSRLADGLVVTDRRHHLDLKSRVIVAGHPAPDENSLVAGRAVLDLVKRSSPNTLIIFLLSGGGSSVLEIPITTEISLPDLRALNHLLVTCGAAIHEINVVRKHLSAIKGGRLGFAAREKRSVALLVSDVNRSDLNSLASNPLFPDDATLNEFHEIIDRFGLKPRLPDSVVSMIDSGRIPELPRGGAGAWGPKPAAVLMDNSFAMSAAAGIASERGFVTQVYEDLVEGSFDEVADELIRRLMILRQNGEGKRVCLISGGEVSCQVTGEGLGGRNQHFVLYSAARIARMGIESPTAVLSCGTDGIDGNSAAAGAVACELTVSEAAKAGLDASDYIRSFDSYSFFSRLGGSVLTGPTGNNVRDIRILLAGS